MAVLNLTQETFDSEVLASDKPVLVDFWASWCTPCKMLAPTVHEVAEEVADRIKVVKVNTDDNPDIAQKYEIMAIPTLILFKNGEIVARISGTKTKAELLEFLA